MLRAARPLVVSEVGVGDSGRHDEEVAIDPAVGQHGPAAPSVDRRRLGENDRGVSLPAEDSTDGSRDVARFQGRRGRLVKQRLKEMMVALVDHRHPGAGGSF
jgi:hypothetical protein